ncbi:hypothetical protein HY448_00850 [Candidatus Pacearchaeota archaeon]|nr:hypothetical protein [Candidatus Pacearchaeota archaeon]
MSFYNTLNYNGQEWSYVFVDGLGRLDNNVQEGIAWNLCDMHCLDQERRNVNQEEYEARIEMIGRRSVGTIVGKAFKVNLESEVGTTKGIVLLMDKISKNKLN